MAKTHVKNVSSDTISAIHFHPDGNKLLTSSWDKTLRLYNLNSNSEPFVYPQKAAVLDCAFLNDRKLVSGGLSQAVLLHDIETKRSTVIGRHENAVSCVLSHESNLTFSGSWDKTFCTWDSRAKPSEPAAKCKLKGKVFALDSRRNKIVICCSRRKLQFLDSRNLSKIAEERIGNLHQNIRSVKINPDLESFVYCGIEGKISIDYFDPKNKRKHYAFKCHRVVDRKTNTNVIYPINSIVFHPIYLTFATGGSDGTVNIWDGCNKKRVSQLKKFDTAVSCMDIDSKGKKIAIALGNNWEKIEQQGSVSESIVVHKLEKREIKRKN